MRDVAIVGVGMTQFGKLIGRGLVDLGSEAGRAALGVARMTLN